MSVCGYDLDDLCAYKTFKTVTVRDRDTAEQTRISLDKVESFLAEKIGE